MTEATAREAEEAVIGAMLLSSDSVWDVAEVVRPEDFYEPTLDALCETIFALANEGKSTGPIEVCDELRRRGLLKGNLDTGHVMSLVHNTPTTTNAGYWATIVRDRAMLRRLQAAAAHIGDLAMSGAGAADELVEQARAQLEGVSEGAKSLIGPIGDHFDEYVNSLAGTPRFVPSPWWDLNALIGGFRSGCLYILGARPAQGKSIVGLQAAVALSQVGPVAFASLEMGRNEIMTRLIAQLGPVHLTPLMNHTLSPMNWQQVAVARPLAQALPIHVAESTEVSTLNQVRAFARSVKRQAAKDGKPMGGLVLDYTQLLTSGSREESRQVEVSNISRSLKLLAKALDIPVIALSQLNRASEKGGVSRKPTMAELRESGSLEQDADVVLLLHHDEVNTPNDVNMIVPKNRHGRTGDIRLRWEGQFARVLSRSWSPTYLLDGEGD